MAGRMPRGAPPQQKAAMEGALTLAIRMGLPPGAFLARLLQPSPGAPELYEEFRSVVRLCNVLKLRGDWFGYFL